MCFQDLSGNQGGHKFCPYTEAQQQKLRYHHPGRPLAPHVLPHPPPPPRPSEPGPGLPRTKMGLPASPRCRQCCTWQCCPMSNSAIFPPPQGQGRGSRERQPGAAGPGGGAYSEERRGPQERRAWVRTGSDDASALRGAT